MPFEVQEMRLASVGSPELVAVFQAQERGKPGDRAENRPASLPDRIVPQSARDNVLRYRHS